MLNVKKMLTKIMGQMLKTATFTATSDENGFFQMPSTYNNIVPLWAETANHTSLVERPYFFNNAPSYGARYSIRFKQWNDLILYESTQKTITIWYLSK